MSMTVTSTAEPCTVFHSLTMDDLRDFRSYVNDVLQTVELEHTPATLHVMRSVCSDGDRPIQAKLDLITEKLKDTAPGRPRIHAEILASVVAGIRLCKPHRVLDVGCGEGMLLRALTHESYIKHLVGVDINTSEITQAEAILGTCDSGNMLVETVAGDITDLTNKNRFHGWDMVVLTEVIEHIADKDWTRQIFELQPCHLIITTPNKSFNCLYPASQLEPNGLRHPDHDFEFTHDEFRDWANALAADFRYSVDLLPIGPADIQHGSVSQLAFFHKLPSAS